MNELLKSVSDDKKVAVIIVGYQLLVSAKQCQLNESDDPSIDIILEYCGFDQSPIGKMIGNIFWEHSIQTDPHLAFDMIFEFSSAEKAAVKEMLQTLVVEDNTIMRQEVANHLSIILDL